MFDFLTDLAILDPLFHAYPPSRAYPLFRTKTHEIKFGLPADAGRSKRQPPRWFLDVDL